MNDEGRPVMYAIVTGSSRARDVGHLVDLAQADGWAVCVVASPDGRRFIDAEALVAKTGYPVRSTYKEPGTPDLLPPADAMIVAPITCNSLAKWAAGISDTLPLGLLVEAVGKRLPVVAVPYSNPAHLDFPAIQDAITKLSGWGVTMVAAEHHESGTDASRIPQFPWIAAWQAVLDHPNRSIPS